MKKLLTSALFILLSLAASGINATSLPDYYPANFTLNGTLDRIDKRKGILVINDHGIRISARLRVYTPNTQYGTIHTLQAGQHVAIRTSPSRNIMITEIWVLPKNYTLK